MDIQIVSILGIIVIRAAITYETHHQARDTPKLDDAIDVFQVLTGCLTLATNIAATTIVALKSWYVKSGLALSYLLNILQLLLRRHRRMLKDYLNQSMAGSNRAERVLSLLTDSGSLYIASTVISLSTYIFMNLIYSPSS
jgi:hypothetical protein